MAFTLKIHGVGEYLDEGCLSWDSEDHISWRKKNIYSCGFDELAEIIKYAELLVEDKNYMRDLHSKNDARLVSFTMYYVAIYDEDARLVLGGYREMCSLNWIEPVYDQKTIHSVHCEIKTLREKALDGRWWNTFESRSVLESKAEIKRLALTHEYYKDNETIKNVIATQKYVKSVDGTDYYSHIDSKDDDKVTAYEQNFEFDEEINLFF
jgi:hypothetical protein